MDAGDHSDHVRNRGQSTATQQQKNTLLALYLRAFFPLFILGCCPETHNNQNKKREGKKERRQEEAHVTIYLNLSSSGYLTHLTESFLIFTF
jgi:hypothetical protein